MYAITHSYPSTVPHVYACILINRPLTDRSIRVSVSNNKSERPSRFENSKYEQFVIAIQAFNRRICFVNWNPFLLVKIMNFFYLIAIFLATIVATVSSDGLIRWVWLIYDLFFCPFLFCSNRPFYFFVVCLFRLLHLICWLYVIVEAYRIIKFNSTNSLLRFWNCVFVNNSGNKSAYLVFLRHQIEIKIFKIIFNDGLKNALFQMKHLLFFWFLSIVNFAYLLSAGVHYKLMHCHYNSTNRCIVSFELILLECERRRSVKKRKRKSQGLS